MTRTKLTDILKIPTFSKAKVLSGRRGLEKHVATVSVAEVPDIIAWAKEGTLYLSTLYAFRDKDAQRNLIQGLWKKGAAGLVIKPKRFLDSVPSEMIDEAQNLGFPLIEVSPEVAWSELMPEIFEKVLEAEANYKTRADFVEALLTADYSSEEEISRRGESVGCDLKEPQSVMVVDIDHFSSLVVRENLSESDVQQKKEALSSLIEATLEKHSIAYSILRRSDSFIILAHARNKQDTSKAARAICDQARQKVPPLTVSVGVGEAANGTEQIRTSFAPANAALRIVHLLKGGDAFADFKDVEDYVVLANLAEAPELGPFLQSVLGRLIDFDTKNRAQLLLTLRTYLVCSQNKAETARKLFIHLNTLKYRLHKIEEILEFKLSDPEVSFRLNLAIRLLTFKHQTLFKTLK